MGLGPLKAPDIHLGGAGSKGQVFANASQANLAAAKVNGAVVIKNPDGSHSVWIDTTRLQKPGKAKTMEPFYDGATQQVKADAAGAKEKAKANKLFEHLNKKKHERVSECYVETKDQPKEALTCLPAVKKDFDDAQEVANDAKQSALEARDLANQAKQIELGAKKSLERAKNPDDRKKAEALYQQAKLEADRAAKYAQQAEQHAENAAIYAKGILDTARLFGNPPAP